MLMDANQPITDQVQQMLIDQVKNGDQLAYKALYDMHKAKVYGLCLRLIADEGHAQDATQEVFVQVWHKIAQFDGRSQFSTWLYSVTSNIAISYVRKQKHWFNKVISFEQSGMDEQSANDCNGLNGLDKLIVRLPERARMVFVLYAVEGYRHEEIATLLGMTVGSSKAQYHRARQLLKQWYENE